MEETNLFNTEESLREFCELLERKDDQNGRGFHPSRLYPVRARGVGVLNGESVSMDDDARDQRESGLLRNVR